MKKLHRLQTLTAAAVFALATLAATAAEAQNPHFLRGPAVSTTDRQVCVSGDVAGLGNTPLNVAIEVQGEATTTCRNPGGNIAPGQGVIVGTTTESASFTPDRRGRARFNLCATLEPQDFPAPDPDDVCPNGNWTVDPIRPGDITITSYTITISWAGQILFQTSFP